MHKYLDKYEKANSKRETEAKKLFPFKVTSPEEYAARHGHNFTQFPWDQFIYEDKDFNDWIHTLGDIFSDWNQVRKLREKYLTKEEIAKIEQHEKNPF